MERKIQRHLLIFSLVMAALSGFVCGCGDKEETATVEALSEEALLLTIPRPRETEEEAVEYTPCTISFSSWGDEEMAGAVTRSVEAFEQKYPGIKVEVIFDSSEGKEESREAFQAGTMSDVMQLEWDWLFENPAATELCLDLYEADPVLNRNTIKQKYLDQCTVQGALLAVPVSMTGKFFFFQESIFESAGIRTPKTFGELREAGKIFQDILGDEYYPLALTEQERMFFLVSYLKSVYGKQWVVDGEFQYKVEELEDGMEFLRLLEEDHVIPSIQHMDSQSGYTVEEGWKNGFYGGVFIWDNELEEYENGLIAGRTGTAEVFAGPGIYQGGYPWITMVYAISGQCNYKREAALWVDFLLNQEEGMESMNGACGIPLSKAGREYCLEKGILDEKVVAANQEVLDALSFPAEPKLADMIEGAVYHDAINGLSYGDYNAREAAQLLADKIETALE